MTTFTQQGVTRPGAPLPRQLNYESSLLFHLRAADLLLGYDPTELVARAFTGEAPVFTRASAGGYTRDALGYLRQWGQGTPRLEMYDLDGDGYYEEPGLLLEGARTNAFTRSKALNDGIWTKTRATVSADAVDGPDRTLEGDKLVEDGTASATHKFDRNTPALTDSTQQSFSVFAKPAGRSEIQLTFAQKDGTFATVWFDLSVGTVGTATGAAVGLIKKYADGWFRCMLMADSASGATTPNITVAMGSGGETVSYNGDSASGVYFWGMQFETDQAFPSSFILTIASTVTRVADALTYVLAFLGQTLTSWLDDLTVYARMARPLHADATGALGGPDRRICQISSTIPLIDHSYVASSRVIQGLINTATTDSSVQVAIPSGAVIEVSSQYKNLRTGGQVALDVGAGLSAFASAATAITAWGDTTLRVGSDPTANAKLDGVLFDLKVARGLRTLKQMQEAI